MWTSSIGFQTKQLDRAARRNQLAVAWCFAHKLHMTMEQLKRFKFAHSKSFAVSVCDYGVHFSLCILS